MSGRLVSRVLESDLRPDLKFTAVVLASFGDDEGYHIRPTMGHVAYLRGLKERQVQYHVDELRRIEVLDVFRPSTQWHPTHYRMRLDKLPARSPYRPPDRQHGLWPAGESPGPPNPGVQSTAPLSGVQSSAPGVQPTAPDPSVRSVSTHTYDARARGAAPETAAHVGGESPIENRAADAEAALPLVGVVTRDRHHLAHAYCDRVCVPKFLHKQFKGALGGLITKRAERLRAFYAQTLAAIPADRDIGDEPVRFWRAAFAARFGGAAPARDHSSTHRAAPMPIVDYDAPEAVEKRRRQAAADAWLKIRSDEAIAVIDALPSADRDALEAAAREDLAGLTFAMNPEVRAAALHAARVRIVLEVANASSASREQPIANAVIDLAATLQRRNYGS